MEHPKAIGDRSTLAIMAAFDLAGYIVSVPFGENTRYDLVVDDGGCLSRVQCKTGRLREGAVRFNTCSVYAHHPNPKVHSRHYRDEVDSFAVYCPENGAVYLIPISDLPSRRTASLRVDAANTQVRGVRPAARYKIATVVAELSSGLHVSSGGRGSCA
ncbi:MAG: hypothetical protein H0X21_00095 [Actinobacteria bacterium]|nr:hypothetical protein [Actinomycetota bacterium]